MCFLSPIEKSSLLYVTLKNIDEDPYRNAFGFQHPHNLAIAKYQIFDMISKVGTKSCDIKVGTKSCCN